MRFELTPAAERVMARAAACRLEPFDDLEPAQVLLGLVAEEECRAARILLRCGIDQHSITGRWPELRTNVESIAPPGGLAVPSSSLEASWLALRERFADQPRLGPVGTEHLLLALAAAETDTGRWLREQGVSVEDVESSLREQAGIVWSSEPLDWPSDPSGHRPGEPSSTSTPMANPDERVPLIRWLDAAENRCREGMRVVEDYCRFVLDDRTLTGAWKDLRHALRGALEWLEARDRLGTRDTANDVGTNISGRGEYERPDLASIVGANIGRVQEALRALEEGSKSIDPRGTAELEQLRYRSYSLEQATLHGRGGARSLVQAWLYVLLDGQPDRATFEQKARALVEAEVDLIQLRDKQLSDRDLLDRARLLRELTRDTPTGFIMNDRADLAVLADADGVHVGQAELSVAEARRIIGPRRWIGVSTHSVDEARQAVLDGAHYIGVGPTFPSQTKEFTRFTGLDLLRAVAAETSLPAFAIGGLTLELMPQVFATGIQRVAVSAMFAQGDDPRDLVEQLRRIRAG